MGFFDFLKKANNPNGLIELDSEKSHIFFTKDEAWSALIEKMRSSPVDKKSYLDKRTGPYAKAFDYWMLGLGSYDKEHIILKLPSHLQKQWYIACIGESEWEELETKRRIERENKERIARIANQIESGG